MEAPRIIHGVIGILGGSAFLFLRKPKISPIKLFGYFGAVLLGTWVPDWDLWLGIGFHRSPLTHGVFPAVLFRSLLGRGPGIQGFCIGLASHLLWDAKDNADVRLIVGRNPGIYYLVISGVALTAYAWWGNHCMGNKHNEMNVVIDKEYNDDLVIHSFIKKEKIIGRANRIIKQTNRRMAQIEHYLNRR